LPPRRAKFTEKGFGGARIDAIAAPPTSTSAWLYHYYAARRALHRRPRAAYVSIRSARRNWHSPTATRRGDAPAHLFTWHFFSTHPVPQPPQQRRTCSGRSTSANRKRNRPPLHSPLVSLLATTLDRGAKAGEFREGRPIRSSSTSTLAALGFFYLSNRFTLSTYLPPRPCRAGCAYPRGEQSSR